MIKSLAICIGGIFIGAVGMEIIQKNYPKVLIKLYKKAVKTASGAKEAFKAGYENTTQPQKAAPAGA
jgi:hypothetical protein